jgi:phenylalanyl-tRNA synthetase beta chain
LRASQRATDLICEIAQGDPAKETAVAGELPENPPEVSLTYKKCDQVLGLAIKPKTVDEILTRFGLRKSKAAKATSTWKIPSYRRDLQRDVDLIEEVVRAHGVEKIAGTDRSRFTPLSAADHAHDLESALRERLVARGFSEVRTSKLIPRRTIAFSENAIALRNPLSEDHVALRPSLITGLLNVLERNIRAGAEHLAIFEMGRVFEPSSGREERRIGFLLWGAATSEANWRKRPLDFFDLKGAIEANISRDLSFRRAQHPNLALAVEIYSGNQLIGLTGQIAASLASKVDAPSAVFVGELSLDFPISGLGSAATFREFGKFPAITRDIALVVDEDLPHEDIVKAIFSEKEPLLTKVEFFDRFVGEEAERLFGKRKKSLAYKLTYRDKNRTLRNEEVTEVHARIRERLKRELDVTLRE